MCMQSTSLNGSSRSSCSVALATVFGNIWRISRTLTFHFLKIAHIFPSEFSNHAMSRRCQQRYRSAVAWRLNFTEIPHWPHGAESLSPCLFSFGNFEKLLDLP